MTRLDRAGAAVATWLRALPADDEPGALGADLALVLMLTLDGRELLFLAAAAMLALDAEDAEALAEAALSDLRADTPVEREAERQRQQWAEWCRGRPYSPPRLTAAERRRADQIQLEDSPRARLAEAWAGASARDRRDLIDRATRGVAA